MQQVITSFTTGFSSSNPITSTAAVTVITVEQADITINKSALRILIQGAIHYQEGPTKDREAMYEMLLTLTKEYFISDEKDILIVAARTDIDMMRHFTECYLTHQENIKGKHPELFDADTYITGKLLLLDLREWQVGQVIYKEIID